MCVVPAGPAEDRGAGRCGRGRRRRAGAVGQLGPVVRLLAELQRGRDGADAALPPRLLPGARVPPPGPTLPGLRAGPAPPRGAALRLPRARHLGHPHVGAAAPQRGAAVGRAERQRAGRAGGAAGQPPLTGPAARPQDRQVRGGPWDTLSANALESNTDLYMFALWEGCPPLTAGHKRVQGQVGLLYNRAKQILSLPFKICVMVY